MAGEMATTMLPAGVSWPVGRGASTAVRGHRCDSTGVHVVPPDDPYRLGPILAPGGDLHMSIRDLARWAAFHLEVLAVSDSEQALFHDGTAGTFFCRVVIFPARDRAIAIAANAGPPCGQKACEGGLGAVMAEVRRKLGPLR